MGRPPVILIFVYNADSSPLAQAFDFLHKAASPATYQCNLCRVTYGLAGPKKAWTRFLGNLPHPAVFLHWDKFREQYPELAATALPAIFGEDASGNLTLFASAEELKRPGTVQEMKDLILSKLA